MGVLAAAYAQIRIAVHARGAPSIWGLRIFLAAIGIGVGYVASLSFAFYGELISFLAFVAGFGWAHVPAAGILFIKAQRGEYD